MSEAASSRAATVPKKKNGAPHGNKNAVRLNLKARAALDLLAEQRTLTVERACELAQCSRSTLYYAINSEAGQAHIASLIKRKRKGLEVIDAHHTLADLMRNGESEYIRNDIAKDVLAQAGVRDRLDVGARPAATGGVRITFISSAAQPGATAVQIDVDTAQTSSKSEG